jgi:DNA-binding CsgD family transcriptional regulator
MASPTWRRSSSGTGSGAGASWTCGARGTSARFSPAEAAWLGDIAVPVTTAPRRSQADAFLVRALRAVPRLGPVVLLLSPDLDVLRQAPQTQEYLRVLVPPAAGQPPVPASAYNAAAQLLATEAGVDANPPWARVHLPDGLWLTLHAARIGAVESGRERDIAVTIEQTSPPERVDPFARAFGFTARESELVGHLVAGADTRELARRMFLSGHTVQDHLKSIFAKTSTHNRLAP